MSRKTFGFFFHPSRVSTRKSLPDKGYDIFGRDTGPSNHRTGFDAACSCVHRLSMHGTRRGFPYAVVLGVRFSLGGTLTNQPGISLERSADSPSTGTVPMIGLIRRFVASLHRRRDGCEKI